MARALRRYTPLKRKKSLRWVSGPRRRELVRYYRLREQFLENNFLCQICGKRRSHDIHHKRGRDGEMLCAFKWWMALCRPCHRELHDNPRWAREQGYLE